MTAVLAITQNPGDYAAIAILVAAMVVGLIRGALGR